MPFLCIILEILLQELKKRNGEFVSVMLNVVCGVVKYQLEELEESPPADIVKRAADMIGRK